MQNVACTQRRTGSNVDTQSKLKTLLCHLYACGDVARKDIPSVVGTDGYAKNLLHRYSSIMKTIGTKENKCVRLCAVTKDNEKQMKRLLEDVDPRLYDIWRNESIEGCAKWCESGEKRQRAFKRARASFYMRQLNMQVDPFLLPPLTVSNRDLRWVSGDYYDAIDIKRSKEGGQNDINNSSITGMLYLAETTYCVYWLEDISDLEKLRARTEANICLHIKQLAQTYAPGSIQTRTLIIMDESLISSDTLRTIESKFPNKMQDVDLLPRSIEKARSLLSILIIPDYLEAAKLVFFDDKNIISKKRYEHGRTNETIGHIGIIPNVHGLLHVLNKIQKGSQHNLWSIQKIPDYAIYIRDDQEDLYMQIFAECVGKGVVLRIFENQMLTEHIRAYAE